MKIIDQPPRHEAATHRTKAILRLETLIDHKQIPILDIGPSPAVHAVATRADKKGGWSILDKQLVEV